uniref:Secreted protein n=1 Tax=Trichogramma kaykai TaxID=54128 RepID=A0ABD2WDQ4_9HYME
MSVFSGSFILSYLFVAHAGAFLYTGAQGRCRTHCPGYKIAHKRRKTWHMLSFDACTQQQRMTPKALLRRRRSPSLLSTCNGRQTQSPPICLCCCQFTGGAGAGGGGGAACAKCASHVQEENERLEKPAGSGADFSSPWASVADEGRIERREKSSSSSGAGARRDARGGCRLADDLIGIKRGVGRKR